MIKLLKTYIFTTKSLKNHFVCLDLEKFVIF